MTDLRVKRIGLVLSGGGAKGAYQGGMFRAMEELGIMQRVVSLSGCSIGAYAAAIYALRGNDEYRDFLYNYPQLVDDGETLTSAAMDEAKAQVAAGKVSVEQFVSDRRFWQQEGKGLYRYIRELVSGGAVERCGRRINVCGYSLEKERPIYFDLDRLDDEEKALAIIGSGSLQFLLRPVALRGHHLVDGGVVPVICKTPAPADKIPLPPMIAEDVDCIIVNFLIASDSVKRELVPQGIDYFELRPSTPLEEFPGSGTLDFSPEKLESHERIGYRDTIKLFKDCIL